MGNRTPRPGSKSEMVRNETRENAKLLLVKANDKLLEGLDLQEQARARGMQEIVPGTENSLRNLRVEIDFWQQYLEPELEDD